MFLLFPTCYLFINPALYFTFQYVSIISVFKINSSRDFFPLYIPICFYYFSFDGYDGQPVIILYIPICFYYFPECYTAIKINFDLYIPICFYYFCLFLLHLPLLSCFTFQYVSIISDLIVSSFQSEYLYIPICFYYFRKQHWNNQKVMNTLHSNMFLLFQLLESDKNYFKKCFTFQYVSIISV